MLEGLCLGQLWVDVNDKSENKRPHRRGIMYAGKVYGHSDKNLMIMRNKKGTWKNAQKGVQVPKKMMTMKIRICSWQENEKKTPKRNDGFKNLFEVSEIIFRVRVFALARLFGQAHGRTV